MLKYPVDIHRSEEKCNTTQQWNALATTWENNSICVYYCIASYNLNLWRLHFHGFYGF